MRFFADHCFFACGVEYLRNRGHDVLTAKDAGLASARDEDIVSFCNKEKRIILTLDADFSSLYRFPLGSHRGVVLFRLSSFTPDGLLNSLKILSEKNLFDQFEDVLVVVRENKLRIVKPGGTQSH